jgi:phytoene dehydrogenase-like protein
MLKSMMPLIPSLPKMIKVTNEFGNITSSEFASRYFEKNSKLFNLFSKFSYPDASAVLLISALAGVFEDFWTVKGGMQSWADVLADSFREKGGDLKLRTYIDTIITKKGTAVGVSCKDTVYEADVIISAGDYKKTFLQLLDDKSLIPDQMRDSIENAAVSEGFFTVYLALDMPKEELGKYLKSAHVFNIDFKPNCDIYDSEDKDYFSKTAFYLYSPSMVNPTLAPDGKSSLMIQSRAVQNWMNNWGGGNKETYKQLKHKAMEAMIDRAAELIPGLKESIEYKDAATPLTYERFTHNTDGASTAWSSNPKKGFFKNALGTNIKTPVRNLYIGSCWAMQLGGVPGAVAAAYECVKKIK